MDEINVFEDGGHVGGGPGCAMYVERCGGIAGHCCYSGHCDWGEERGIVVRIRGWKGKGIGNLTPCLTKFEEVPTADLQHLEPRREGIKGHNEACVWTSLGLPSK